MTSQLSNWKQELQETIDANLATRANGKVASFKTQDERGKYLFAFFTLLRRNGYAVSPKNLKSKHIQVAMDIYTAEVDQHGNPKRPLTAATIQTYLMHLRAYARWIGKDGMVGTASEYIGDETKYKRSYQAMVDKGFEGRGVDNKEVISDILYEYPYVYYQMLAQTAFGLRCKEALFLRPYMHIIDDNVHIVDGAKGGKQRIIPIENDNQIQVANQLKAFVGKSTVTLMEPQLTIEQNYSKYYRVCKKFGLTKAELGNMHSARADYAMNFMLSQGLTPLVKGGTVGELEAEKEMQIRLEASRRLGHNRVGITTAYSGPVTERGKTMLEKHKKGNT